jgi:hypothetical protein
LKFCYFGILPLFAKIESLLNILQNENYNMTTSNINAIDQQEEMNNNLKLSFLEEAEKLFENYVSISQQNCEFKLTETKRKENLLKTQMLNDELIISSYQEQLNKVIEHFQFINRNYKNQIDFLENENKTLIANLCTKSGFDFPKNTEQTTTIIEPQTQTQTHSINDKLMELFETFEIEFAKESINDFNIVQETLQNIIQKYQDIHLQHQQLQNENKHLKSQSKKKIISQQDTHLQNKNTQLMEELKTLQTKYDELFEKNQQNEKQFEQQITKTQKEINKLQELNTNLETRNIEIYFECKNLQLEFDKLEHNNNEKQTSIDNLLNSNIILQTKCEELEAELKETQNELLEQLKKQEENEQEDAEQDYDEQDDAEQNEKQDDNDAEQDEKQNDDEDEEQDNEEQNDDEEQEQEVEYEIITINKKSYALNPITKQLFDYNEDEGFDEDAPIGIYDEKKNKIVAK